MPPDGGYAGQVEKAVLEIKQYSKIHLQIVNRGEGFEGLPENGIVERIFGSLLQSRRLVRECEGKTSHSQALIYLFVSKGVFTDELTLISPASTGKIVCDDLTF